MVLFQLWESPPARHAHAEDPHHRDALRASGMLEAMTATRSRVFEDAQLTVPTAGYHERVSPPSTSSDWPVT